LADSALESTPLLDAFVGAVDEQLAVARLGLRVVPLSTRTVVADEAASTSYWVGEGLAKPVTAGAFDSVELPPTKCVSLSVITNELIKASAGRAVRAVQGVLVKSQVRAIDSKFASADAATASTPAGVLNGVSAIASTGDPTADLAALLEAYDGDLTSARFLMSPGVAAQLALRAGSSMTFADVGVAGGSLLGIPVVVSKHVASDSSGGTIILLDASAILYGDGGVTLDAGTHCDVAMQSEPTGDATTGTGSSLVSMFQSNSTAVKVERYIGWQVARAGAVVWVESADYAA
jgi:HK97 family phage major capsid protein